MLQINYRQLSATSLFLFLLVCSLPLCGTAQQISEYAAFDSIKVGDTFTFSITLDKDRSYEKITYPDSSHFGTLFEIRSRHQFNVSDYRDSLVYELQFFGTEDTTLARLPVTLVNEKDTTQLFTNPVPIHFKSVLTSEEEEFRPFKPIFDFAAAWWPYLLALLLLALAAWYLYKQYLKKMEEPEPEPEPVFNPKPFKDPLKQLESTLKQLKSFSFSSQEDFMQFYINLGDAIRTYFEDLYHIPALESTSREILHDLNRRAVDEELVTQTRKVLNEADMVKFANFTPSEEQASEALGKAEVFLKKARKIDGTKVDRLRRKYRLKMEKKRKTFKQQQKKEDSV